MLDSSGRSAVAAASQRARLSSFPVVDSSAICRFLFLLFSSRVSRIGSSLMFFLALDVTLLSLLVENFNFSPGLIG